jgi:hypothetical protein
VEITKTICFINPKIQIQDWIRASIKNKKLKKLKPRPKVPLWKKEK